jgi:hypothetical protein
LIYSLTQFQIDNLTRACNEGSVVFAVPMSCPADVPEKAQKIDTQYNEIMDLIRLELLKDVSEKFSEAIEASKMNAGRGFKIVAITPACKTMFEDYGKVAIN